MDMKYISEDNMRKLLGSVKAESVYSLFELDTGVTFERVEEKLLEKLSLRCVRPAGSVKAFLIPAKERVAVYPGGDEAPWEQIEGLPRVIVGVRACGLNAVAYLDKIFLEGDFKDPFYEARREKTTLVSVDCVEAADKCFCTLIGEKPYADEGADLMLTPVEGGYVAAVGSEKGKELVEQDSDLFTDATEAQLKQRDEVREKVVAALKEQNKEFETDQPLEELVGKTHGQEQWIHLAVPCVECGACTNVCPTCYCFMLHDELVGDEEGKSERMKIWDSCIYADYSRMAGVGGVKPNPRAELRTRFENRFMHKFAFSCSTMGRIACVGCGRCIEACLGGIDIRAVLRDLAK